MTNKLLRSVSLLAVAFCFCIGNAWAQTGTIEGTVIDAQTQEALVSANVYIPSLERGAATDISGDFTIDDIPYGTYELRVQYIGYETKTVTVTVDEPTVEVAVQLKPAVGTLDELVVTALGGQTEKRAVTFAAQSVSAEELTVTQNSNIKTSLAGKIAGVQILGQAGAKLGLSGDIRIRGEISLTSAVSEPLYVVDGVPVGDNPNIVNMANVAEITVLKGPNASALYGQRGENGVILITTKEADAAGVSVEVRSSFTFQDVAYLPKFQDLFGQGYGQDDFAIFQYNPAIHPDYFATMDGVRFLTTSYADASWGPKLDGEPYAAWFNWFPDSPYYGETVPWSAKPNNVEKFYDTGWKTKNGLAINIFEERYQGRISYANLQQGGILPFSKLQKHFLAGNFGYDVTEDFHVEADFNYTTETVNGQVYADAYGNQTSGSFNNWFGRQLSMDKMRELANLRTPDGYYASWNWWNPNFYTIGESFQKPVFWFNPYTWMKEFERVNEQDNLLLSFTGTYQLSDHFELFAQASTYQTDRADEFYLPYSIARSSAEDLYIPYVNSFGLAEYEERSNNYSTRLNYRSDFGEWDVDAFVGGNIRAANGRYYEVWMNRFNYQSGGLIIPNVYQFSNSAETLVPTSTNFEKRVYSLYGNVNVGYKDFLYLKGTYRQDWSSALPEENNGYGYPSLGASFVFTELIENDALDFLTYGKLRGGWAQTGDDVGAEDLVQSYFLSSIPYSSPTTGESIPLVYTSDILIDPNIKPALQSSWEVGTDLRFVNGRIGLSATYYVTKREDEIIPISISNATGRTSFLTNAGSTERTGIELSLDGYIVRNNEFQWNMRVNFATGETIVKSLPAGLDVFRLDLADDSDFGFVYLTQVEGEEWGQLRGTAIQRTEDGTPILNESGLYLVEPNHLFGSVLPDFTGGILNSFSYKNFSFSFLIDFQGGGKFFSLSEQWGHYTGLMKSTAKINDRGVQVRKPVSEGGGIHVTGVRQTGVDAEGNPTYTEVDTYIPAQTYFTQFFSNRLAEPYIHNASYVKLRAVNLSYTLPTGLFGGVIKRATFGVVARNLWLIYVAPDNVHEWDPSELAEVYGENGQLPGTRSIGFNLNITF